MNLVIIDSDKEILDFFKSLEKKMNFKALLVDKTAKALFSLKKPQDITIVFLGDGRNIFPESIDAIQLINPNVPIFIMADQDELEDVKKSFYQGIRGVLSKPLSMDEISDCLQQIQVIDYFKEKLQQMADKMGLDVGSLDMDGKTKAVANILKEASEYEYLKQKKKQGGVK